MSDHEAVWTIGYQGRTLDGFIDTLSSASVDMVVDIRSKPVSRKPGFSKGPLSRRLDGSGIQYIHMPKLGMPLDLLNLRSQLADNRVILDAYREGMSNRKDDIDQLCNWTQSLRICFLCFESDATQCHRGIIAEHLQEERQLEDRHL